MGCCEVVQGGDHLRSVESGVERDLVRFQLQTRHHWVSGAHEDGAEFEEGVCDLNRMSEYYLISCH